MSLSPRLISRATFASSSRLRLCPGSTTRSIWISSSVSTSRTAIPIQQSDRIQAIQYNAINTQSRRNTSTTTSSSSISSNTNSPPPSIPSHSNASIKVIPPSLKAIKDEGFMDDDVNLIPENEARLIITPEAIQQLANITSREPPDVLAKGQLALRVGVESGGCHGYQYTMALTEERGVDDYIMQPQGIASIPVVIDLMSLGLMKGATLHFATELIGSSFRIQDNPQAKEGGACGCGVSWEAKI